MTLRELERRRFRHGEQVERGGRVAHIEQRLLLHGRLERRLRGHCVAQCGVQLLEAAAVVEVGGKVKSLLIGQQRAVTLELT